MPQYLIKILLTTTKPLFILLSLFSFVSTAQVTEINIGEFKIDYEVKGTGDYTLLLEAGYSDDLTSWKAIFDKFSKVTKTIRYTRVGNKPNSSIQRQFSAEDYARQLDALLQNIDVKQPVVIVSHSYGALISRMFAAKYPERIAGLLLIDPNTEKDNDIMRSVNLPQANKAIENWKLSEMNLGMKNNAFLDYWSKRPMPSYPEIKDVPVSVIISSKKYTPVPNIFFTDKGRLEKAKWHKAWAANFPRGKAVVTTKSGHYIHNSEPELVIAELKLLLSKLTANKAVESK